MSDIRQEFEKVAAEIYGEEISLDYCDDRKCYVYEKTCNCFALYQAAHKAQQAEIERLKADNKRLLNELASTYESCRTVWKSGLNYDEDTYTPYMRAKEAKAALEGNQ